MTPFDGLGRKRIVARESSAPATRWRQPLVFFCLYLSFGATLGFLGGGAPLILRAHGAALAQVGLLQLIYLPLGLTFLWSGLLDRTRLPFLSHRVGWIVAAQVAGIGLLLLLGAGEAWPAAALLATACMVSFTFATMDIASEALVVESVAPPARPAVTTAKLCGSSLGGILGTGLLSVAFAALGWAGSFVALAGLNAACLLPLLRYPEAPRPTRVFPAAAARARPLLGRCAVIGFYFAASGLLLASSQLVLLDLRVSLAQAGFIAGTLGPAINLGMTLASGALMATVSADRLIAAMTAGVAASGALSAPATATGSAGLAVAAVVGGAVAASGLGVPVFTAIYRWAQGPSAATSYSLLFGIGFLAAMPGRVGGPALAGVLGWPSFFALATSLTMASLWLLRAAVARSEAGDGV